MEFDGFPAINFHHFASRTNNNEPTGEELPRPRPHPHRILADCRLRICIRSLPAGDFSSPIYRTHNSPHTWRPAKGNSWSSRRHQEATLRKTTANIEAIISNSQNSEKVFSVYVTTIFLIKKLFHHQKQT